MMIRLLLLLLALLVAGDARAQNGQNSTTCTQSAVINCLRIAIQVSPPTLASSGADYASQTIYGGLRVQLQDGAGHDSSSTFPIFVVAKPVATGLTVPGCTVGTSSAQCLASSLVTTHLQIQNVSAAATIACTFGGTAALNTSNSFQLGPGQPANWGGATSAVPTGALNCIANVASTPLYLEYN